MLKWIFYFVHHIAPISNLYFSTKRLFKQASFQNNDILKLKISLRNMIRNFRRPRVEIYLNADIT